MCTILLVMHQAVFLRFKPGDVVLVEPRTLHASPSENKAWWLGQIIWTEAGARDPNTPTMFQIANVDTGGVEWINADEATRLVLPNYEPDETDEYVVEAKPCPISRYQRFKRSH